MSGWYAVKRGTIEHELFAPVGKWSRFEAWSWMVENAAYRDTIIDIGGKPYTVKRGSLCFSQRFLADRFKWSKKALTTFLERLEAHGAIVVSVAETGNGTKSKRTQITFCNYEKYQSGGTKTDPKGDQKGTKEEQVTNIPVGANADAPADPAKLVFDSGVKLLVSAGKNQAEARRIIGKWRQEHSDEALLAAIGRCQREGAVDPVSYIAGALRFHRGQEERRKSHPEIGDTRVVKGVLKRYAGNGVGWITSHE